MSDNETLTAWYESWLAATRMALKINTELGLDCSGDMLLQMGEKVGVSMMIEKSGSKPKYSFSNNRQFSNKPAATMAEHPCPVCGSEVYDNRENKLKPTSPDFKCKNKGGCDPDGSGYPWGGWLKSNSGTVSVEELFGIHDLSNAGIEASANVGGEDLPF